MTKSFLIHRASRVVKVNSGLQMPTQLQAQYTRDIGPPLGDAKTFFIMFDTGSSDFWVFSNLMGANALQILNGTRVLYNPLDSTTAIPTGQAMNATYFEGAYTVAIGFNDTLTIGGIEIKNQTVGAAIAADVNNTLRYDSLPMDGIMGLTPSAPNRMVPGPARDVMTNLFFGSSERPTASLFTACLTRTTEPDGFFTFGYIDDDLVGNSTITYVPGLPNSWFWEVPSEYIIINGNRTQRTVQNPARTTNTASIDSGTTQILVSDDILPLIYEPLGGIFNTTVHAWVFPANVSQMPTIVLPIGEYDIAMASEDFDFAPIDENWIQGSFQSRGAWYNDILGDVWIKNLYAIFDLGDGKDATKRFGFVPRAPVLQHASLE